MGTWEKVFFASLPWIDGTGFLQQRLPLCHVTRPLEKAPPQYGSSIMALLLPSASGLLHGTPSKFSALHHLKPVPFIEFSCM